MFEQNLNISSICQSHKIFHAYEWVTKDTYELKINSQHPPLLSEEIFINIRSILSYFLRICEWNSIYVSKTHLIIFFHHLLHLARECEHFKSLMRIFCRVQQTFPLQPEPTIEVNWKRSTKKKLPSNIHDQEKKLSRTRVVQPWKWSLSNLKIGFFTWAHEMLWELRNHTKK